MRVDKRNYYLDIAQVVSKRGTCLRRNYGAVLVKNDVVISTGYTGAPRGRINCIDRGKCIRKELEIPRGQNYEKCRSVHAEMNCIINCSREEMLGSTLYLVGLEYDTGDLVDGVEPCMLCKRMIINAGIKEVIIRDPKLGVKGINVSDWVKNDDSLTGKMGY